MLQRCHNLLPSTESGQLEVMTLSTQALVKSFLGLCGKTFYLTDCIEGKQLIKLLLGF